MIDNNWERLKRLYEEAEERAEFWKDKDPKVYMEVLEEQRLMLLQAAEIIEAIETVMSHHKKEES